MLKPFHSGYFENYLMLSYLEDSLANPFQGLEKERELKMKDTSGPLSSKESKTCNPTYVSSKMLTESSQQNPPDTTRYSTMSSVTWKKTVTQHRGRWCQRVKFQHPISENGYLSWRTEQKRLDDILLKIYQKYFVDVDGCQDPGKSNTTGNTQELHKDWATPNTMDYLPSRSYESMFKQATTGARKGRTRPANLREQVDPVMCQAMTDARESLEYQKLKEWPTSRLSDAEGGRILTEITENGFRSYRKSSDQWFGAKLRDAVETYEKFKGRLNPRWVEQLMGLPENWVYPDEKSSNRIDEIRMLGNGVVPPQAELAIYLLIIGIAGSLDGQIQEIL